MKATELVKCVSIAKEDLGRLGGGSVPVGTANSWNLLINGANAIVVQACDIVLANDFSI